jgi:uracil-DNA glycosylase
VPLDDLVGPGWADVLAPVQDTIAGLGDFLRAEQAAGRTFAPAPSRILAALTMPFDAVRVLVVGQDPYPTPGHAIGLAFAVARDVRPLPPSLGNLLHEYATDLGLPRPTHGDLGAWVEQGVLLLNRCLTVQHGAPGSHRGRGWEQVTDAIVDALVTRDAPLVALLWGRDAQQLAPRLVEGWRDGARGTPSEPALRPPRVPRLAPVHARERCAGGGRRGTHRLAPARLSPSAALATLRHASRHPVAARPKQPSRAPRGRGRRSRGESKGRSR